MLNAIDVLSLGAGSFQRIKWDKEGTKEIVIYTSTEGVHYCGLHELYTKVINVLGLVCGDVECYQSIGYDNTIYHIMTMI